MKTTKTKVWKFTGASTRVGRFLLELNQSGLKIEGGSTFVFGNVFPNIDDPSEGLMDVRRTIGTPFTTLEYHDGYVILENLTTKRGCYPFWHVVAPCITKGADCPNCNASRYSKEHFDKCTLLRDY